MIRGLFVQGLLSCEVGVRPAGMQQLSAWASWDAQVDEQLIVLFLLCVTFPDVQAYIMVKYKDKGPLDLVAGPGGLDTAWAQVQCYPLQVLASKRASQLSVSEIPSRLAENSPNGYLEPLPSYRHLKPW